LVVWLLLFELGVEALPLLVIGLPVILILLHGVLFFGLLVHSQGLLKSEWVDFL
jgi:hypothetical protein